MKQCAIYERPYEHYVKWQSQRNPSFINLCAFMQQPKRRECRLACLDFNTDFKPLPRRDIAPNSLKEELCGRSAINESVNDPQSGFAVDEKDAPRHGTNAEHIVVAGRMIVIEDLSRDIIETLGSCLDIDPLFFASHIHAPEKALESLTPELVNLPSRYKNTNFLNIHYHRTIILRTKSKRIGKLFRDCNIPRKLAILPPIKGAEFGLVQHCCSVLRTVDSEKRWLGRTKYQTVNSLSNKLRHCSCRLISLLRLFSVSFRQRTIIRSRISSSV